MIDIKTIPEQYRTFFEKLLKNKEATYDWGKDLILINGDGICSGEIYIQLTNANAVTSADIVVSLLQNNINVTLINYFPTFKTEADMLEHMEYYKTLKTH